LNVVPDDVFRPSCVLCGAMMLLLVPPSATSPLSILNGIYLSSWPSSGGSAVLAVGFEECIHLFIEIFRALVGAQCTRMSSQLRDQATVCVNEVVLVREEFHVFGAGVGAYEDYEALVSTG